MHFYRHIAAALLLLALSAPSALAQEEEALSYPAPPAVTDPLDQHMQRIEAIYQKDPRFEKLPYDTTLFSVRGCAPSSMANMVIAAFDVQDADIAAQIVDDTLWVLCPGKSYRRRPIDQNKLSNLLSPQQMLDQAERYPGLAASVGQYGGAIDFTLDDFTLERVQQAIAGHAEDKYMTTGRISVRESWEDVIRILHALHAAGEDDALLILAYAGAGTASGTAPLRTSSNGHYLTLCLPVRQFIETGRLYVLDSMPRALFGEEYRPGLAYRRCYAFVEEAPDKGFNARFTAARIRPEIIRIDMNADSLAQLGDVRAQEFVSAEERTEALIAKTAEIFEPFILYSTCTALLRMN